MEHLERRPRRMHFTTDPPYRRAHGASPADTTRGQRRKEDGVHQVSVPHDAAASSTPAPESSHASTYAVLDNVKRIHLDSNAQIMVFICKWYKARIREINSHRMETMGKRVFATGRSPGRLPQGAPRLSWSSLRCSML